MGNLHKSTYIYQPVGNSTPEFWCAQQDTVPRIKLQQDTIPKVKLQQDTSATTHEGINPLFLMIERKSAEVEAYRESLVVKSPVVYRPKPKLVDTTCYICPLGQPQTLVSAIERAEGNKLNQFTNQNLYDAQYYLDHIAVNQQVFIETQPAQNHYQPISINVKPLPQNQAQLSWLFYPVFSLLILLVFIRVFFAKHLQDVFRSTLFFHSAKKMFWENASLLGNLFRLLDISLYISIPTSVIIVLNTLDVNIEVTQTYYIGFYTLIGLILLRIFRSITTWTVGFVSNQSEQLKQLNLNQHLHARVLGIALIPLNILALYTFEPAQLAVVYTILGITTIILFLRFIRIVQVFLFNQFSMFYLFLYLCALEFIPLLLVFKEIFVE